MNATKISLVTALFLFGSPTLFAQAPVPRPERTTPTPEKAADAMSVVKTQLTALGKGDAEAAWKNLIRISGIPKEIEDHFRKKLDERIRFAKEREMPEVVEQKIAGDCAVVLINERPGEDSPDYDPVYLLKQDGKWKLFHSMSSYKQAADVAPDTVRSFQELEAWYKQRKAELRKQRPAR